MQVNIAAGSGTTLLASEVTSPANSLNQLCSTGSYTFTLSKSSDATYNFNLSQTDLGTGFNSGAVATSWVRDTVVPTLTVSGKPAATNYDIDSVFTFAANETSTYQCQLDSGSWIACTSPYTYTYLSGGNHTVAIKATDRAGNVSSTFSYTWNQQGFKALALYHFEGAAGTTDSSLLSTPNTLTNNSSTQASAGGKFSDGRTFTNGTSQWMSIASNASLTQLAASGKMTVEAFVKFTTLPTSTSGTPIVSKSAANPNLSWDFKIRPSSTTSTKCKNATTQYCLMFIGSSTGTGSTTIYAAPKAMVAGTWYHVAVTYDLGSVKMYLDGVLVGTGTIGTAGSTYLKQTTATMYLGKNGTGTIVYLNGVLDEVRLSQVVRTITVPGAAYSAD